MRQFSEVFQGRRDCYGETRLRKESVEGQKNSDYDAEFIKKNVTPEHYAQHLDPNREYLLGIVPIDLDNLCNFAAIDLDEYQSGKELGIEMRAKIDRLGLPLIPCYSKSYGVHLYAFFAEPVPADKARAFMRKCADSLGLNKKIEIFPKQDKISSDMTGSYINLPYWKSRQCRAVSASGGEYSLDEFLQEVAAVELYENELDKVEERETEDDGSSDEILKDAPPCVVTLISDGIGAGERSNALTNIAIFAKKRSQQVESFDWEGWLSEINFQYCSPPMKTVDLAQIIRSVSRTDFAYLCKQQPMAGVCDKEACLKRRFGVGGGNKESADECAFEIFSITKILASPPYYMVRLTGYEDQEIKMTSMHLTQPRNFVRAVFEQIDTIFPTPKASTLAEMINAITVKKEENTFKIEDAPEEMEDISAILSMLEDWIKDHIATKPSKEELQSNNPIYINDKVVFRGRAFLSFMKSQGVNIEKTKVFDALRSQRAKKEWFKKWGEFKSQPMEIEGESIYVWSLPLKTKKEGGWFEPRLETGKEAF